jgi:hypothetical protein
MTRRRTSTAREFSEMGHISDEDGQRLDETFLGPLNARHYRANEVAALSGVDREVAEDAIRTAGGNPRELSPDRQQGLDNRLDRGDLIRGDVPGLRDEEVLTETPPRADADAVPTAREQVTAFALDETPLLFGDGETTGPRPPAEGDSQTRDTRDVAGRELFAGGDTPFFDPVVKAGRTVDLTGTGDGDTNDQSSPGRLFRL